RCEAGPGDETVRGQGVAARHRGAHLPLLRPELPDARAQRCARARPADQAAGGRGPTAPPRAPPQRRPRPAAGPDHAGTRRDPRLLVLPAAGRRPRPRGSETVRGRTRRRRGALRRRVHRPPPVPGARAARAHGLRRVRVSDPRQDRLPRRRMPGRRGAGLRAAAGGPLERELHRRAGRCDGRGDRQGPPRGGAGMILDGGAVTGLRALSYDPETGSREADAAARDHGWTAVCGVDLRNPVDAESRMEAAAAGGTRLVRFAATRQGIPGTAPRLRLLTRRASALGLTILVEGSTRSVGLAMMGLGATVIFLDQHFYDAGEFILTAREEPGFHASTRLLGNPDAWETIAEHVGAERLVFGARSGWSEEHSVLARL